LLYILLYSTLLVLDSSYFSIPHHRKQYVSSITVCINAVVQYFLVCSLRLQVNNFWIFNIIMRSLAGKGNLPSGLEISIFFLSTSSSVQKHPPADTPTTL
jgi:hypothetical protein